MSVMQQSPASGGHSGNLYESPDPILDKGLVIDGLARAGVVGIELITVDLRLVVASVDTYPRFAESCDRLNLSGSRSVGLPELLGGAAEKGAQKRTRGALGGAEEAITDSFEQGRQDESGNGDEEHAAPGSAAPRKREAKGSERPAGEQRPLPAGGPRSEHLPLRRPPEPFGPAPSALTGVGEPPAEIRPVRSGDLAAAVSTAIGREVDDLLEARGTSWSSG